MSGKRSLVVAGVVTGALLLLRPGTVEQAARSPRAWLTVGAVVGLAALVRVVAARLAGPRTAAVAGTAVVLVATVLLIGPSFRQRSLHEPLPDELTQQADALAEPSAPASAGSAPSRPAQLSSGRLQGIDHSASGRTLLYSLSDGGLLRFADVDIEGAVRPSVHLVPRGARRPSGGVRLGALKAERGSFTYRLPASVQLTRDWTVLVWCDPFDTPIAAADLA